MNLPTRMPGRWTIVFESYTWSALPIFVSGNRIAIDCGGKMNYHSVAAINRAKVYYIGPEFKFCDTCLGVPN